MYSTSVLLQLIGMSKSSEYISLTEEYDKKIMEYDKEFNEQQKLIEQEERLIEQYEKEFNEKLIKHNINNVHNNMVVKFDIQMGMILNMIKMGKIFNTSWW